MYKLVKSLIVIVLAAVLLCYGVKRANVDCDSFQPCVDFVVEFLFPSVMSQPETGESSKSSVSSIDNLLEKLHAFIDKNQQALEQANNSIRESARKLDEWQKQITSGEDYANRVCNVIEVGDYPATVLGKKFYSEQDAKVSLESVLSQMYALQKSTVKMKKAIREVEENRDKLVGQIAEAESKVAECEALRTQREREAINIDNELKKMEDEKDVPDGATDLASLTERIAKEEEEIKEASEKHLEVDEREKMFQEYYVKYKTRVKSKSKTDSKDRRNSQSHSEDDED